VFSQHRSPQHHQPQGRTNEGRLVADMIELVRQYGQYGYRLIAALLRDAGWQVCDGRIERLRRREGLKGPARQPSKSRLTLRETVDLPCVWLDVRGSDIDWLFCHVYRGKPVARDLSTTTVKRLLKQAGLDPSEIKAFSGHSMRVGAAQDLLMRGVDNAAIMRAGGWKSVNVLTRYLEQVEHNVWA